MPQDWLDEGIEPILESKNIDSFIKKKDKYVHKDGWICHASKTAHGPEELHEICYITIPNEEGVITSTRIFVSKRPDLDFFYPYRINIDFDSAQKSIIETFKTLPEANRFVEKWKKQHPEG